ncbi:sugar transporter SWEET1-like isoform X1 [Varroa jacobsoni]|uniref:sugar transporter SWEET1-like isoform X1 n=1 Tax=Varroa jacobsoni TaxID=62625 RepID=UPI000BF43671|nr:sugar transporter SWEET1-like isoform X1 [Varroa jacobsoni]
MNWTQIVADLATLATIINFASGIYQDRFLRQYGHLPIINSTLYEICHRIYKQQSTSDCTPMPFMMGMLCSFLWFQYAILKPDMVVVTLNVIGFTLQTTFLFWFYLYTKPKGQLNVHIGALLLLIVSFHTWLFYGVADTDSAMRTAGYLAIVASIAFFASPLTLLARVLQTRSSQYLPLPLILSSFTVGVLWTLYGLLKQDTFITIPNVLASLITACQLILICIFPRKPLCDTQRLV